MQSSSSVVIIFCICVLYSVPANGYKILGVFPFYIRSHYILANTLLKGLAETGHEITILTVFEEKIPPKNGTYKQILMEDLIDFQKVTFGETANLSTTNHQHYFLESIEFIMHFTSIANTIAEKTLNNTKMQDLIKSKEKFDALIVHQVNTEVLKALAPHFGAHLVLFNTVPANSMMNHFVGNPTLASIHPELLLGMVGPMSFPERFLNNIFKIIFYLVQNLLIYPYQNALVQKYISKELDLTAIQYNVSLVLSNSHPSYIRAESSVPCMKEVGGFHIEPPKELPRELKRYLDNATEGVIYFSMGSRLKGVDLPLKMRQDLMRAFSRRREKILWKFEDEYMPGKPDNVKIDKWLPQSDILAHPNVKLFIMHGGLLSTTEAIYHGVPTIMIPILADQLRNARMAETDGYAMMVEFKNLNEKSLYSAIEEVVSNKKYLEQAKSRSKVFHDRQMKPMDEAIYWIEYIVRHNGAKHLRVDYLDLAWYQYYLLDVFTLMFFIILLSFLIVKKTVCALILCKGKGFRDSTNKLKSQ